MKTSALLVLALVFFFSFVGRLTVIAAETVEVQSESPGHSNSLAEPGCVDAALAVVVKERLAALEKNEANLAERNTELKAYELQIEKRLADLKHANTVFTRQIDEKQKERDADIAKLAAIYEGMKPAQASEIMAEMDPKFAAGLLSSMSNEQAAQVVASMDSEKAYLVSVILANQSQTN